MSLQWTLPAHAADAGVKGQRLKRLLAACLSLQGRGQGQNTVGKVKEVKKVPEVLIPLVWDRDDRFLRGVHLLRWKGEKKKIIEFFVVFLR